MLDTPFKFLKIPSHYIQSTFNVSLGIAELEIRDETLVSVNDSEKNRPNLSFPSCPNTTDASFPWDVPCASAELGSRLSLFSQWRGTRSNDSLGLWHLMSGCATGSEIGIAWLATLSV